MDVGRPEGVHEVVQRGGVEVLAVREVPDPVPGPDEALVAVRSSALNRADLLQRRGLYPGPPMDQEIPGLELAGTVAAVGERVTDVAVISNMSARFSHAGPRNASTS